MLKQAATDVIKSKQARNKPLPNLSRRKVAEKSKYVHKSNYKPYQDKSLSYFIATSEGMSVPKEKKFKQKGQRQTSLGERLVADWLIKNNIRFKREKEFSDLINPMTGKALSIDFYLHTHKIVIEFDGRQHFKASKLFDRNGDSLEARIQRDRIKDTYCRNKGFKMIRIKYTEINLIDSILKLHF